MDSVDKPHPCTHRSEYGDNKTGLEFFCVHNVIVPGAVSGACKEEFEDEVDSCRIAIDFSGVVVLKPITEGDEGKKQSLWKTLRVPSSRNAETEEPTCTS